MNYCICGLLEPLETKFLLWQRKRRDENVIKLLKQAALQPWKDGVKLISGNGDPLISSKLQWIYDKHGYIQNDLPYINFEVFKKYWTAEERARPLSICVWYRSTHQIIIDMEHDAYLDDKNNKIRDVLFKRLELFIPQPTSIKAIMAELDSDIEIID